MRFIQALLGSAVSFTFANASGIDYCAELCRRDPSCDPDRGSYCKVDHNPATCYSYYFESPDKTGAYYYRMPEDDRSEETPVLCSDAEDIINGGTTPAPPAEDYCELLCTVDADCQALGRGSYLKYWQTPAVCYSFVLTDEDGSDFFYWNGVGDDSFPMSHEQAEAFFNALASTTTIAA